jgi:hypothetical protein
MNELIIDLKRTEIEAARPNPVGRAWSADELNRLEAEVVLGLVFSGYNALESWQKNWNSFVTIVCVSTPTSAES